MIQSTNNCLYKGTGPTKEMIERATSKSLARGDSNAHLRSYHRLEETCEESSAHGHREQQTHDSVSVVRNVSRRLLRVGVLGIAGQDVGGATTGAKDDLKPGANWNDESGSLIIKRCKVGLVLVP